MRYFFILNVCKNKICSKSELSHKPSSVANDHLSRPVVANRLKRLFPGHDGQPYYVLYTVLLRMGFT